MNLDYLGDYYIWADNKLIDLLKTVSEEDFTKVPSKLQRSMRDLTEHMISTYEFIAEPFSMKKYSEILKNLSEKTKGELFRYWSSKVAHFKLEISKLQDLQKVDLPESETSMIQVEPWILTLSYTDHNTYHRGQLITTYKLVTGNDEAVNTDFYNFVLEKEKDSENK